MKPGELALKFQNHLQDLEFMEAFGLLADDGQYTVIGTTPASRVYHGPQDIYDNLIPLLSRFKTPPQLEFDDPMVEGDRVVMLGRGAGVGPTGDYHQPFYAFVGRARGDRFSEMIEFMDTQMLQTAVFGQKLVAAADA